MAFWQQYPFEYKTNNKFSYATHDEVQSYLEDFYDSNNIKGITKFDTTVNNVFKNSEGLWNVSFTEKTLLKVQSSLYDAVIICNGHYDVPFVPNDIKGYRKHFNREVHHSKEYDRIKSSCAGKTVLVVGSKSSGTDLARELSSICPEVHVADRSIMASESKHISNYDGNKIVLHPAIIEFEENNGIKFADGTKTSNIDSIIWCTGFKYDFPFLENDANREGKIICLDDPFRYRRVKNLYFQLFNIYDPSIAFIGLPFSIVPFPIFYIQSRWLCHVWGNTHRKLLKDDVEENSFDTDFPMLPCIERRLNDLQDFEKNLENQGLLNEKYHYLGGKAQFDYCRMVAEELKKTKTSNFFKSFTDSNDVDIPRYIDLIQAVYENNARNKPPYTGASDSYRNRKFTVDFSDFTFQVTEV